MREIRHFWQKPMAKLITKQWNKETLKINIIRGIRNFWRKPYFKTYGVDKNSATTKQYNLPPKTKSS